MENGIPEPERVRGFFVVEEGREGPVSRQYMQKFSIMLVIVFICFFRSYDVWGGENDTHMLDTIVVTAERIEEYVKNHPQDVKVVNRKEIAERNLSAVEEVLKSMPGVDVTGTSGSGSRISIRGSGKSGGVLILLNGRPLNTNQYGSVDLNAVSIDAIESVTVFKPPVPVWLGPGGSEGVINIVTRDLTKKGNGQKGPMATIKAGAGSFGLFEGSGSYLIQGKKNNVMFTGGGTSLTGRRANSDRADGSFGVYWTREEQEGSKYEMNGRYYEAKAGSAGPVDNPTPDARQRYRKGSFDGRVSGLIGDKGTYGTNLYGDMVNLRDRSQYRYTSTLDSLKLGIKPDVAFTEEKGLWELRLNGLAELDSIDHSLTGTHHRAQVGLGGQYDQRIGPFTGTLGLRGDHTDDFHFNPGFNSGVGWAVTDRVLIRGRAGYVVNVPTFEQLYQTSHGSIDQTRGNPDLREERIWSYDVGFEYKIDRDRQLQIVFFRTDTRDLIAYERGNDLIYRPSNIKKAVRQGVEMTLKYGWINGFAVDTSVIFQDSCSGDTRGDLPYTPEWKIKNTFRYVIPSWKTQLEGIVRYEGSRYSQEENLRAQRLKEYVTTDFRMVQPFVLRGLKTDWYLKIDNLFNTPYESHIGYPDEGIRFSTGVQMRF